MLNKNMIELTQDELNDKFLFMANYTDNAVNSMSLQLVAQMETIEHDQNNANIVLENADTAIRVSLNETQVRLGMYRDESSAKIFKKCIKGSF